MTKTDKRMIVNSVDSYIQVQMQADHIPGLALAIIRRNEVVLSRGYGFANLEHHIPVTVDSAFEICSITKQFTVAAIMHFVEAGALELDSPVTTIRSDLPEVWKNITVRHLLTATSGIKEYLNDPQDVSVPVQDSSWTVLQHMSTFDLDFAPGECWSYSNTGYVLLSLLVEQCSGTPYRDFLKTHIFENHHLHKTCANDLSRIVPNRVNGYFWEDGKWLNRRIFFAGKQSNGDGELISTLTDLIKWDTAWRGNQLLSPASLQQIWTPAMTKNGTMAQTFLSSQYGFGWFLETHLNHRVYWTPGAGDGFSTSLMRFPDDDITVIVLTNCEKFLFADTLARGIGAMIW